MALEDSGEALASDATAVTFFRITATARQTQRLAARAAEPIACCEGKAMVVWSRLSGISFNELAAAEGQQLGLNAHLQALGATGLLRAREQCMGKYYYALPSGQGRHRKRRRVNEELNQLGQAV